MLGKPSPGEWTTYPDDPRAGYPRSRHVPDWSTRKDPEFHPRDADPWRERAGAPSLYGEFRETARRYPDRIAIGASEVLTYASLAARVDCAADGLMHAGMQARDVVAIVAHNDWRNVAASLAVLRNRGCCLLVSPTQNPAKLAAAFRGLRGVHGGRLLVDFGDPEALRIATSEMFHGMATTDLRAIFHHERNSGEAVVAEDGSRDDDPAFLFLTSGSTGMPRLVRMGHRFVLADIHRQVNDLAIVPSDRFDLLFAPTFSAFLAPVFGALLSGASLWIRSLHEGVPDDLFRWLASREITVSTMSVSLMRSLLSTLPPGEHWPSLRLLSVGGESLHRSDVEQFRSRIASSAVLQNAMASTETRTYAQRFITGEEVLEESIPIGYPVLDREVVVLDDQGVVQPEGVIGELEVRARCLADGYCVAGVASEGIDGNAIDRTGFRRLDDGRVAYRTGDLGYVGPDGLLRWVGRKDSMVKIRGQKVYLQQVEAVLKGMEGVHDALVTVFDDSDGTARVVAAVVAAAPVHVEELRRQCERHMDAVAVPSRIVSFDSFPRTDTGKMDRVTLATQLAEAVRRDTVVERRDGALLAERPGASHDAGRRLVEEVTQRRVSDDTRLTDLDLDSLTRLRITLLVSERLGKRLGQEMVQSCETVRDLTMAIDEAPEISWRIPVWTQTQPTAEVTLFTSIAGSGGEFDALVEHLLTDGDSSPTFSLSMVETAALRLADGGDLTMEAFARPLVERWLHQAARVPQVLVGYSWGGLLAYEIASQMARVGRPVAELVLIDTVMHQGLPRGGVSQWARRVRNLPRWLWHDGLVMDVHAWKAGIGRTTRRMLARGGNDRNASSDSAYHHQYVAADRYHPPRYRGSVHVLRATSQSATRPLFGALGWERFVTPVPTTVSIPGNHLTILGRRSSRSVAAALTGILRHVAADAGARASSPA